MGRRRKARVLGRVLHLSLLQDAWQDVKSEQALSPDGIVAAFTSRSIFPLTAEVGTDPIGYLAIGFPAKSVTPPVFDWYGFPYSKSYLIAHQNIGYLTDSF